MSTNLFGPRRRDTRTVLAGIAFGVVLVTGGCSSSASVGTAASASTTPDTTTTTSIVAETTTTTTAAPVTTLAATTTEASTTTTAPVAEPLILRGDGIGPFDLGMPYAEVLAGLSARLTLASDDAYEYPVVDEYGGHRSADESRGFVAPYGRVVCWSDGADGQLCAAFGGDDAAALSFVGWSYGGKVLGTISGLTGGSLWSEFPTLIGPDQGGCYSESSGMFDGVLFTVVSVGTPFGTFDESGNYVSGGDQNPADVSVTGLATGAFPFDTDADC